MCGLSQTLHKSDFQSMIYHVQPPVCHLLIEPYPSRYQAHGPLCPMRDCCTIAKSVEGSPHTLHSRTASPSPLLSTAASTPLSPLGLILWRTFPQPGGLSGQACCVFNVKPGGQGGRRAPCTISRRTLDAPSEHTRRTLDAHTMHCEKTYDRVFL